MNSALVKLGFLAAGVAIGVAAVKLMESDKVIVIREEAINKVKDTAEQAVNTVRNTADQIKNAVADKIYHDDAIISFNSDSIETLNSEENAAFDEAEL